MKHSSARSKQKDANSTAFSSNRTSIAQLEKLINAAVSEVSNLKPLKREFKKDRSNQDVKKQKKD